MNIPLVDLKALYHSIKYEIDQVVQKVIDNAAFVNGRYVKEFEEGFASAIGGVHYPIVLPNLLACKYLGHKASDFPFSSQYQDEILSLPTYPEIGTDQIRYIADCIGSFSHA